ncbi:MBL fold metallo-hydrolase [Fictibacillus sp. BK138]|uniref:MBL fold metallo-hydrolase n=1 Tax=Fictibacillus sp. BK138 TaxID=2512121 RepID=UPI00102A62AE|nr:MBL fold metallo-hydrolase [Fictibacillus sp. BK138]RZT21381.1 metallo-beta-lactamase superfamily protein [Fictibacillus sp. BK138]
MQEIRQLSRFHKVGQGQFYSSSFYNVDSDEEIRYVIDCGADKPYLKSLNTEIDIYLQTYNKSSLHLLILSHLHYDHVSGLKKLLDGFKALETSVDYIIIPYIDDLMRIFLFAKYQEETLEEWFFEFLLQPVEFLKSYTFVKNVLIIHPSDNQSLKDDRILPSDYNNDFIHISRSIVTPSTSTSLKDINTPNVFHIKNTKISFYSLIELDFWYKQCNQDVLIKFKEALKGIDINKELENFTKKSKVYKQYLKLNKDINDTSLCVSITFNEHKLYRSRSYFHFNNTMGFLLKDDFLLNYKALKVNSFSKFKIDLRHSNDYELRQLGIYCNTPNLFNKSYGYLFTGDINLSPNKNGTISSTFESFTNHYLSKSGNIGIIVVPHHGSEKNWDVRLLNYFNDPFFVISSGIKNKYRHPDFSVVNDLYNTGWAWANNEISFNHGLVLYFK